ncbi:Iron hydrogenase [Syntrophomonas zehnderi OL-4]|uniref:Iron hydrogenase n=1 Tax=Syntrophomonas zehnderi OL-4 TaxID=690567 RepID=A0A0E4G9U1_9FIRM|nr:NADH-dependent [FeFe] hydrogenase, group A6 [Syntrophomonas zehnderi]CFX26351.1 Iron hydrogenase [Syntrophomonas zehnderi OL-4]
MDKITLSINGNAVSVAPGTSILSAAQQAGVNIPTLCHHPDQEIKANCRICVVEVKGYVNLLPACATLVSEGMEVKTTTARVLEARRTILELILARHPQDCLHCMRNGNCELQNLTSAYDLRQTAFSKEPRRLPADFSSPAIVRDPNKCILCGRCTEVCSTTQTVHALGMAYRGYDALVVPSLGQDLLASPCVMCGQCIHACPVGAIGEREQIGELLTALADPQKIVVTQIAPSVRLAIAEEWGRESGSLPMEQLVAGIRNIGFDYVLNTNFTADLTVMEESRELLERITTGGTLPMFTSCCPAWIRFAEIFFPQLLGHISSCKSPQQMFGALVKTYWAEKTGIDPAQIYSVAIMPCTAKKYEALRPEMKDSDYPDVDLVLTTRELGRLFHMTGVNPFNLEGSDFDSWMSEYSGAGVLFGASGGVAEAALRTVCQAATGQELPPLDFQELRGMQGVKTAELNLNGDIIKVAAVHSLSNARELAEAVKAGESPYHFIEVMACPGGCIGGGGQAFTSSNQLRACRIGELYNEEKGRILRNAHDNNEVKHLYEDYLHNSDESAVHELLHTHYSPQPKVL